MSLETLLSLPSVQIEPITGAFQVLGGTQVVYDEIPGACLCVLGHEYCVDESDYSEWWGLTIGELRKQNLLAILDPGIDSSEWSDDTIIDLNQLHPELIEKLYETSRNAQWCSELDESEAVADKALETYADAECYIKYMPRGFANECDIFAVAHGELGDACNWLRSRASDPNSDWRILTRRDVRELLRESHWFRIQSDSAYTQQYVHDYVDGWWREEKAAENNFSGA